VPGFDPLATGVRLVFAHGGTADLDVTVPGGAYAGSPVVGWRATAGIKWSYVDKRIQPASGIAKITIQRVASTPGRVKFRVKGKKAALPPVPGNPPMRVALVLAPPAATAGQCGEGVLACTFNGSGSSRKCQ